MKPKHTLGPWVHDGILIKSKTTLVAKVLDFKNQSSEANGALLAAAPELLYMLRALHAHGVCRLLDAENADKLEKLIIKAGGEI